MRLALHPRGGAAAMTNPFFIAIAVIGFALALTALLGATRGTPVNRVTGRGADAPPSVHDESFRPTLETYTGSAMHGGHDLELLPNGDATYPRLWADMRAARRFIAIQMYYCKEGRVTEELRAVLTERARAGVSVLFLYDAFGSSLSGGYVDALRAAGVEVAKFRPFLPHKINDAVHRAHSRALVIDGVVGYTGGFGFDDKWLGDGRREGSWRDTNVRVTGPAVTQLMGAFGSCWAEATGELITGPLCFPSEADASNGDGALAGVVHATPTVGSTPAERLVALSIAGARRTLYITNPYFVPDDDVRRFLMDAARRGVDVRILTVGRKTDVKTTHFAARARYTRLLAAGIRVWEYDASMIHAKTLVADGTWCMVGTINTDNRSMAFNNEVSLMVNDATFADALTRLFLDDLAFANEIDLETFRKRPLWERPVEQVAHMMSRLL